MCHVEARAIGRWRDVARSAPSGNSLLFFSRLRIKHSDIIRNAVGNEEALAVATFGYPGRFCPHRPRCDLLESARVYDRDRIVPGIRNKNARAVVREGEAPRNVADRHSLQFSKASSVQHAYLVAALAENVEPGAIGREQHFHGRGVNEMLARPRGACSGSNAEIAGRGPDRRQHYGSNDSDCRATPCLFAIPHRVSSTVITPSTGTFSSLCSVPAGQ